MPWTCDGVPKDGKDYPQAIPGGHPSHVNTTPDCMICGLPEAAMQRGARGGATSSTTLVSPPPLTKGQKPKSQWLIPAALAVVVLLLAGGSYAVYKLFFTHNGNGNGNGTISTPTPTPTNGGTKIISKAPNIKNGDLISQGERILLGSTTYKQDGSSAFTNEDWQGAIDSYQAEATANPNDPEAKIYLNNAQAQQVGNPLSVAVVVPISGDRNAAAEILRGVAKAQEEFNNNASGSLLQVAIADDPGGLNSKYLAEDFINSQDVLGVIGHGIDPFSEQAIKEYESNGLAVLSPRTVKVSDGSEPVLTLIPMDTKDDELLQKYLEAVGTTLTEQAAGKKAVVFYNSGSKYSNQLKEDIVNALPPSNLVKEVDIKGGLDAKAEVSSAVQGGAQVAFLALDKGKVSEAISIAGANLNSRSPLMLLGGDQLYGPEILIDGGDAIAGIVLAVPWSFELDDDFALDALKSWKGKISWRTATAYDATQVLAEVVSQNSDRASVLKALQQGVPLKNKNTDFSIFDRVPLVEAKIGPNHPPNTKYEFSTL
jgi:ABC-type branched-subunit amino acid transport system substrate-binding protein